MPAIGRFQLVASTKRPKPTASECMNAASLRFVPVEAATPDTGIRYSRISKPAPRLRESAIQSLLVRGHLARGISAARARVPSAAAHAPDGAGPSKGGKADKVIDWSSDAMVARLGGGANPLR